MTLVSIIVPTYNRRLLVKRCIENLLEQTYPNLEVIVVDDGSIDNTREEIANIQRLYISEQDGIQIKYYFKRNEGAVVARNFGIKKARGEYLVFHDSDDLMDCKRIENQISEIVKLGDVDGSVGTIVDYKNGKTLFKPMVEYINPVHEFLKGSLHGGTQAWMFSKRSIMKIAGYDENLKCRQDLDLAFRFLTAKFRIVGTPSAITYFYNHDGDRVSNFAQTIEGMWSTITYYKKRLEFILNDNGQDYYSIEIKNLFHLRVECFRNNSIKQGIVVWKMGMELLPYNNSIDDKIYSNFIASYMYYLVSKIYRYFVK